ncbi:MAG: Cytochrome bo(3) ubiquinol oxidase subunit 4 [Chlamydiales bacterium]|nr:Cytochrome bo(3) ubiquinol oxidase subunit 4 [Chlamydiales bacterium]MCH9635857.1 Cytochrome bo(3) ubiquinol oxidase subunit 4 [Chlamydiales bacterium]MCH9703569.1 cytochrome o ubiquinol oxidase subunit IV [Chlamydiota bacterium]
MNENDHEEEWEGDLKTYLIGFGLSLLFTCSAFLGVYKKWIDSPAMILTLAILQFITQIIFFLHLGKESKAHWNLILFGFMMLVVGIVVFGTLWIMFGLNMRTMPWMQ